MRILITGGAGFIGSHIAEHFLNKGNDVIILDNLSSGKKDNVANRAKLILGSTINKEDVEKAIKDIDYVFHLAAIVSVPLSFEKPKDCMSVNVEGTRNVLEAALKNKVKKVIFSSSAAIYGDNSNIPLKESEPYSPLSPYAESKVEGEKLCQAYSKKGLKTCVLRYFNVYGKRQDPKSPYSGVITIFMDRARQGKDIIIFGDGSNTRDFIHVSDVVKANILAMEKLDGIYNIATGKETSIRKLAEEIITNLKSKSKIIYEKPREGDIKKSVADITKIKKDGFIIETDLNKGLEQL